MAEYRVGADGAQIVHIDGQPVVRLAPGTRIIGDLSTEHADNPKMRRQRADKAMRAGRDFEAPEMTAHEDKQA